MAARAETMARRFRQPPESFSVVRVGSGNFARSRAWMARRWRSWSSRWVSVAAATQSNAVWFGGKVSSFRK